MRLTVNPLGEVFYNGITVADSVNVCDLECRLRRRASKRDFRAEFNRQLRAGISDAKVRALVRRVWKLQEELNTDRFRVWVGGGKVFLSTEFIGLVSDDELWVKLRRLARKFGARLDLLFKEMKPEGLEHQVDLRARLTKLDKRSVQARIAELAAATEDLWRRTGVSIL